MKWLTMFCILFALPALADSTPIPLRQQPSNVQIINGKRFYSLSNVRRFTGGINNPKAMSVMHHPRTQAPVNTAGTRSLLPLTPTGQQGPLMPQSASDKVLSVFAPDEKTIPPVPAR